MFSVVIPAYNCEKTIYDSLDSVISQTRVDLIDEIIIINDGSLDNTKRIIEDYIADHSNFNFVYINQDNKGVSATRNEGIRRAKGEWIALLDSDDIWLKEKIERQYEEIAKNDSILFLGSEYPLKVFFKKYRSGVHKLNAKQLCFRNLPPTPSIVFKRNIGISLGLFDENMKYSEDINFFQKFLRLDSYYILAENLIEISIGKAFFAASGLSSNLKEMHKGRDKNTVALYKDGLISWPYLVIMLGLNQVKYFRRKAIRFASGIIHKRETDKKQMFSVIISAYNCEKTIINSLNSVLNQTRIDLVEEVIIVNDGSTDNTKQVIEEYIGSHNDMNINLINEKKHGVSYSRNVGIKKARATWIAILDSDDVWEKNKLERQAEILNK